MPHTMFAISSRDEGDFFQRRALLDLRHGGQHEQREVGGLVRIALDGETEQIQRCHASSAPRPAASIQKRSPKVFVTASPLMLSTEPLGTVYGSRNQSLAYTRPNSMSSSFASSVVPGLMSPKFVLPSSNAHQRVSGMPLKRTGAGMKLRVRYCGSNGGPAGAGR